LKNGGDKSQFDEFWEIDRLIPVRKKPTAAPRAPRHVEATEITAPPMGTDAPAQDSRLTALSQGRPMPQPRPAPNGKNINIPRNGIKNAVFAATDSPLPERPVSLYEQRATEKPAPLLSYRPAGGLVHEVRVYPWKNQYTYYEQFARFAVRHVNVEGSACPEVDFFSYMPQYSQMNRAQLAYYFWWRTNFRRGTCLHASYAYLLLFLYEIINLDDQISPQTGQENMLRLWLSYREHHPRLDVLVREWLCDYSLLHRLPPPRLPERDVREMIAGAQLKEFYVSAAEGDAAFTDAMLYFCSNYDYRKSKFFSPDTAPHFHRALRGAVEVALRYQREKMGENATRQRGYSTVGRDAFSGAICSYRLKRHIEVDFSSFSHTHELRFVITDVLKYAENALRAALGIKSRLSVYEVGGELRQLLDAYLKEVLPARTPKRAEREAEAMPEYERRYEVESRPLSLTNATRIEESSWATTKRLVEAFADEAPMENAEKPAPSAGIMPKTPSAPPPPEPVSAPATAAAAAAEGEFAAALGTLAGFLPLAATGDRQAQRAFALSVGQMPDAVADRINAVAEELLGDIVLEDAGGYYTVIEDYKNLLKDEGVL